MNTTSTIVPISFLRRWGIRSPGAELGLASCGGKAVATGVARPALALFHADALPNQAGKREG
jgi:hypothetical protein